MLCSGKEMLCVPPSPAAVTASSICCPGGPVISVGEK